MRAIVQSKYGPPGEVLQLREIQAPVHGVGDVLVRVHAASLHPDVWHVVAGRPYVLRVMGAGLLKPKTRVPGTDVAGRIEAVGPGVSRFQPGDEVFGEIVRGHQWHNGGAFAEYAAVPERALAPKPANLTFEQAAAVPTSGLIALQSVIASGPIRDGQKVLVNGAGGGVGTFAVQIARASGAEVTAVDGTTKLDMLRAIGADHVVDYTQDDFVESGERYDLIIDIPGNRSFEDLRRALADGGRYVLIGHDAYGATGNRLIGGTLGRILKLQLKAPFGRARSEPRLSQQPADRLAALTELIEAGKVEPVVDRTFPLGDVPQAIHYLVEGNPAGKVVITV